MQALVEYEKALEHSIKCKACPLLFSNKHLHPILLFAGDTAIKFGNQLLVMRVVLQKRPASVDQ